MTTATRAPLTGLEPGVGDLVFSRLFPPENPYADKPISWTRDKLREHMWSAQRAIARSVVKNRRTAVHSCHGSGKSFTAARLVCWWLDAHPPGTAFAITTAPTTHQVDAILWREIGRAHRKGSLPGRITLDSKWRLGPAHGDELVAYGRKPADYDPEAFQGLHQRFVLVVIDEANGVPKVLYDAVDTVTTNEHARILAIGNPDSPTSHFAQICKPSSEWRKIHIDGFRTPNFTGEFLPDEAVYEDLLSIRWVEERRREWGERSPLWESKVRGRFPSTSDDALVQMDWWESAAARDLDPEGFIGQLGVDVARFGEDKSTCYHQRGGNMRKIWALSKTSTTDTARKVAETITTNPGTPIMVDATGIGGGVVDVLKEWNCNVWEFISGATPTDARFADARSQAYWGLREDFEFGRIDVDPEDEQLKNQLTSMKWVLTDKGKIKVESKSDYMKRLRTHSPDSADSAMMAAWEARVYTVPNHAEIPAITSDILEVAW